MQLNVLSFVISSTENKRLFRMHFQCSLLSSVDGCNIWASEQTDSPLEPDYMSIEQLFSLPVAEPKEKGPVAPAKKEPKEVRDLCLCLYGRYSCHSNKCNKWSRNEFFPGL